MIEENEKFSFFYGIMVNRRDNMKDASLIMYKIGKVFNIIAIVLFSVILGLGIVFLLGAGASLDYVGANAPNTVAVLSFSGAFYVIFGLIELAFQILILVFTNKAKDEVEGVRAGKNMQIVMIVFGVLGQAIFHLLGGIFGLIAKKDE